MGNAPSSSPPMYKKNNVRANEIARVAKNKRSNLSRRINNMIRNKQNKIRSNIQRNSEQAKARMNLRLQNNQRRANAKIKRKYARPQATLAAKKKRLAYLLNQYETAVMKVPLVAPEKAKRQIEKLAMQIERLLPKNNSNRNKLNNERRFRAYKNNY